MALLIPRRIKELKDQGREEGREEGRQQGRKEGRKDGRKNANRKGMAWYRRQQAALRSGLPFDEPPPSDVEDDSEE